MLQTKHYFGRGKLTTFMILYMEINSQLNTVKVYLIARDST